MAKQKVLLNVALVLSAGVLFYTFVNSQVQLEDEELVQTARSASGHLLPGAKATKESLQNEKQPHIGKDSRELQSQNEKAGMLEFKPDVLKNIKIRKARAEPETSPTSEPEVSPESEAKPETNPNTKTEPEPFFWAEPEPNWNTAMAEWKTAWPLHVYGIASVFVVLGITSLLELIRIHVKSRRKTALKVSLLTIMAVFCTTRAVTLIADPYSSKGTLNPILLRFLVSIGHPCIISAMSLLLLVLIDTTKMNVAPPTFQRVQFIIAIVFSHVVLVLVTDIVVAYYFETKALILICQIYYLVLGLILTIGYAKVGIKIALNSSACVTRDKKMQKLKILIGLASVTGLAMVCVTIYGAAGVFGVYSDVKVVAPWPWWVFQTILRVLEIIMVVVLLVMNVKVSGSGLSIRELFGKCRKKLFHNKVEESKSVAQFSHSNSWVTNNDTSKTNEKTVQPSGFFTRENRCLATVTT